MCDELRIPTHLANASKPGSILPSATNQIALIGVFVIRLILAKSIAVWEKGNGSM
jgi:hypothetical protein